MTKTTPTIHLVILVLLLTVGGLLFYLTQKQLKSTSRLQVEVNQLAQGQTQLEELSSTTPTLTQEARTWQQSLPATEEEVAIFASLVEQLARNQGLLIILDFDDFPQPLEITGQPLIGLGLSLTLEGSYQGLINFFAQLSASHYFYRIDKLTVVQQETRQGVKATFTGALMTNFTATNP